jgi:hypothetical protein
VLDRFNATCDGNGIDLVGDSDHRWRSEKRTEAAALRFDDGL